MRAGLRVGSVALIGGIYYTRTALNHSLYPGTPCGTYKNKTFTLDVYPWLSAALDGMLLCAPSPALQTLLALCVCFWPEMPSQAAASFRQPAPRALLCVLRRYFLNSKEGMGPCAPPPTGGNSSCAGLHVPWPDR